MPFDWKEYLDIARYLSGDSSISIGRESSLRAAISRAYYAAFCHARNYAINKFSFRPSGFGSDHSAVRRYYSKTRLSAVEKLLSDLYEWRQQCDYDDEVDNIESMCDSAIDMADEVFRKLT
jgi:uncharacterized protein (UPF0332 family)